MSEDTEGIFLFKLKYVMCFRNTGFNLLIHSLIYFIYFWLKCVPSFSNFVFRVSVLRRSGIPAFSILVQPIRPTILKIKIFSVSTIETRPFWL